PSVRRGLGTRSCVGAQLAEHERQGLADRVDTVEVLFGDGDVEALLERHHELDEVEAVGVEVLLEPGFLGDGRRVDGQYFDRRLLQNGERLGAIHGVAPLCEGAQCPMESPPSTGMAAPVIYPAASEHRKATVAPTSSGVPSRASGTRAARSAWRSSGSASSMAVAMGPGATRLQVTLREASSRATDRVSPSRPALAAA